MLSLYRQQTGRTSRASVKKGKEETVSLSYDGTFRYLDTEGHSISDVKKEISLPEKTEAPIKKARKQEKVIYTAGDKELWNALRSFMRKTLNVRDISTASQNSWLFMANRRAGIF